MAEVTFNEIVGHISGPLSGLITIWIVSVVMFKRLNKTDEQVNAISTQLSKAYEARIEALEAETKDCNARYTTLVQKVFELIEQTATLKEELRVVKTGA